MPLCIICGDPLNCQKPHGNMAPKCSALQAAIWVHVMDDLGAAIKDASVTVDGANGKDTDPAGFLAYDPQKPGKYQLKLEDLSPTLRKDYVLPPVTEKALDLGDGVIAYLPFQLARKAELQVCVQQNNKSSRKFEKATVTIKGKKTKHTDKQPTNDKGLVDFGKVPPDDYEIEAALDAADENDFVIAPGTVVGKTLASGEVAAVPFPVAALARPQVHVVWGASKDIKDLEVKLKGDGRTVALEKTDAGGLAAYPAKEKGLKADGNVEYEIEVVFDKDVYIKRTPADTFKPAEGDTGTREVVLVKLARPKFEIIWAFKNERVGDVGVKLAGSAHDFGTSDKTTGVAELQAKPGVEPDKDFDVDVTFDDKVFMPLKSTPRFKFDEGSDKTETIKLVKRARPRVKVIHTTTKKEIDGVEVIFVATDTSERKYPKTRRSGLSELPKGDPGLAPKSEKYTLKVAADSYKPTLVSPADAEFDEDSTELLVVEVNTPKGALLVRVNRYDGAAVSERVKFEVAKNASPTTILHSNTTAERDVEIEKELQVKPKIETRKVKAKEEWNQVDGLDPDTYLVTIPNLDADVLLKQLPSTGKPWAIGPTKDAKVKVDVKAGATAEVEYTLTKYVKAQLIGFSVMPGYADGKRCSTCFAQYPDSATDCTSHSGTLMPNRCPECHTLYPDGTDKCTSCKVRKGYFCHGWRGGPGTCPDCSGPIGFACSACTSVYPAELCPTSCGGTLALACHTCLEYRDYGGPCKKSGCTADVVGICTNCNTWDDTLDTQCPTCGLTEAVPAERERIYLGLPSDHADMLARCLVMKEAIVTAHGKADAAKDVLKVFVAPEFYFRGVKGGYPIEFMGLIMDQMRKETKKTDYTDWLFVFGTGIAFREEVSGAEYELKVSKSGSGTKVEVTHGKSKVDVCSKITADNATLDTAHQWKLKSGEVVKAITGIGDKREIELTSSKTVSAGDACVLVEPNATEIFNVALVQKGGPDDGVAGMREEITYKEKVSHIDFLRNKTFDWETAKGRKFFTSGQTLALPTEGADELLSRNKQTDLSGERTRSGYGGGSVFTIDGVTFGLEVCLDHDKKKLKNYYGTTPVGAPKVQVQLIPSWGMSIMKDSLVGKTGTLVFNVDGPDGSHAAEVDSSGDPIDLTTHNTYEVPQPGQEDVEYVDTTPDPSGKQKSPEVVEIKNLDPKFDKLFVEKDHQINRKAGVSGKKYARVDVYDPEDLPDGETV